MVVDETDGFLRDAVGGVRVDLGIGRGPIGRWIVKHAARSRDQAWSEALRIGRKRTVAEMPFTREEGCIAAGAQALGDGHLLERDVVLVGSGGQLALRVPTPEM